MSNPHPTMHLKIPHRFPLKREMEAASQVPQCQHPDFQWVQRAHVWRVVRRPRCEHPEFEWEQMPHVWRVVRREPKKEEPKAEKPQAENPKAENPKAIGKGLVIKDTKRKH